MFLFATFDIFQIPLSPIESPLNGLALCLDEGFSIEAAKDLHLAPVGFIFAQSDICQWWHNNSDYQPLGP